MHECIKYVDVCGEEYGNEFDEMKRAGEEN